MRYKRKPIEVNAMQYTGDNFEFIQQFMDGADKVLAREVNGDIKLFSLNGYMTARAGDYIIRTKHSEVYPCSKERFDEIYEAIDV